MRALWTLLCCLLVPSLAFANDAAFGGNGADIMPLTTPEVSMADEHIVITHVRGQNAWRVTVDFTFVNTSDKTIDLTMGFPFHVRSDEGDVSTPIGKAYPEQGEPLVWDFESVVRGKTVSTSRQKVMANQKHPDLYYQWAYVWPVKFKPKETIKVRNSYLIGVSMSSIGEGWMDYILKTGGMWKGGEIGRSRIDVDMGWAFTQCSKTQVADTKPAGGIWSKRDDGGWSIHWDLKKLKPKNDVNFCFRDRNYLRAMEFYALTEEHSEDELKTLSKSELRILRNTVFALHGYAFKSADLQKHFAEIRWYRPNPAFKRSLLTDDERKYVNKIAEIERETQPD